MKHVIALLRDNKTKVIKECKDEYSDNSTDEGIEFIWTEGNYSCDCNRYIFFYGYDKDYPCGDERFTLISLKIDGRELIEARLKEE